MHTAVLGSTQVRRGRCFARSVMLASILALASVAVPAVAGTAAAIEATRLQADIWQLAMLADAAASGRFDAFDELNEKRLEIGQRIQMLRSGDEGRGIRKPGDKQEYALSALERNWRHADSLAQRILAREGLVMDAAEKAAEFSAAIPLLQMRLDNVARQLMEKEAQGQSIYLVMRNLVLSDRLLRSLREILQGGPSAVTSADRFARDLSILGRVVAGLRNGDPDLGTQRIEDDGTQAALGEVARVHSTIESLGEAIVAASTELFEVREAADEIFLEAGRFADEALALAESY